jgi:hypothetical protein
MAFTCFKIKRSCVFREPDKREDGSICELKVNRKERLCNRYAWIIGLNFNFCSIN